MANMSYCRFRNTYDDMKDCIKALEERNIHLSEEKEKAKEMIKSFLEFCVYEGIIEGGYDEKRIDEIIDECE